MAWPTSLSFALLAAAAQEPISTREDALAAAAQEPISTREDARSGKRALRPPARPRTARPTLPHSGIWLRRDDTGRHRVRALRRRKARCAGRKRALRPPAHPRTARPTLPHNGIWPRRDDSAHRRVGVLRRPSPTRRSTHAPAQRNLGRVVTNPDMGACVPSARAFRSWLACNRRVAPPA